MQRTVTGVAPRNGCSGPRVVCQVPGFVEACLGRFLSCRCVLVFCVLWRDATQGEVGAAGAVPVDPGGGFVRRLPIRLVPQ